MLTVLSALAGIVHGAARFWYYLVDWLPLPLQVVTFIGVMYLAGRATFTHGLPALAPEGVRLCRLTLRAVAWAFLVPEFLITSRTLRTSGTMPRGVHSYGEAVAGLLEAGDGAVTALWAWVSRSPEIPNTGAVCFLAGTAFLVNAVAYRTGAPLPVALWWDSAKTWMGLPS